MSEELRRKIDNIVKEHKLIKLESDYYNSFEFYYDRIINVMYKVDIDSNVLFEISRDYHIMKLNKVALNSKE